MLLLQYCISLGRKTSYLTDRLLAMQDNYPQLEYTALDLSPYYLYEARKNMKQWHKLRQPNLSMGGVDGSGAHFLQAAAEKIPQPDASQDVVRTHHAHNLNKLLNVF